jgi:hypothetical protein
MTLDLTISSAPVLGMTLILLEVGLEFRTIMECRFVASKA